MREEKCEIKTITLCGSTKFKEEFETAAATLTLHNYMVLMPHAFTRHLGFKVSEQEMNELKKLHKQKIDISDAIMVINKAGYIGDDTKEEIEYAKAIGKNVYYRYIECEQDCTYVMNCRAKTILPPFVREFSNAFPTCPCYCEEDK